MNGDKRTSLLKWHFFAGASVGLLVGLLLGLAVSPVVAASLAALLAAALGWAPLLVKAPAAGEQVLDPRVAAARLSAFALLAVPGLLVGIYLRTHDALGLSPRQQLAQWHELGFSKDQALGLLLYRQFGTDLLGKFYPDQQRAWVSLGFDEAEARRLVSAQTQAAPAPHGETEQREWKTGLFQLPVGFSKERLNPDKFEDSKSLLNLYRSLGREGEAFAATVEGLKPEQQAQLLRNLYRMLRALPPERN